MISELYLHESWKDRLKSQFSADYMKKLDRFIEEEIQKGKIVFPKAAEYFSALNLTKFEDVRIVILGQDPYHGPGQAHGLCFSVPQGIRLPPSLKNIFKELRSDLNIENENRGCLESWGKQGVLLLNSVLTVEEGKAGSHQGKGWELFTDSVIQLLNDEKEQLVFILWGSYAQKKASFVDRQRHLVIESVHPSPLSAHRGFFGTKPFSSANSYLQKFGKPPINWKLE